MSFLFSWFSKKDPTHLLWNYFLKWKSDYKKNKKNLVGYEEHGYYLVAPLSINFLGAYQVSSFVSNTIGLSSFVSTVTTISFANGLLFELPMLVYFLTKIGLLTPDFMRKYRKHAIVLTLILSAIITPPDVTSQVLVALPIIFLYEISIIISKRVLKKQNKQWS